MNAPTPGQPLNSTFGSSPDVVSNDRTQRRIQRLSALFAAEPELILACLEAGSSQPPLDMQAVWQATQRAVAECPGYADVHHYAALVAKRLGHLQTASELLQRALQINPRYLQALILSARVALDRNQPDEALDCLHRAMEFGADYADVHLMLGNLYRDRGEVARARAAYRRSIQINAGYIDAEKALASLPTDSNRGLGS